MALFTKHRHCFFSISIICLFTFSSALISHDHKINVFSVELIHRDSPKSLLFNSSETPSQRLINALISSINRGNHLINMISATTPRTTSISANQVTSTLLPNTVEYLMEISLGTPPFSMLLIADTGSALTWTQCKPCTQCFTQTDPLFDTSSSATYKNIPCRTDTCLSVTSSSCAGADPTLCPYTVEYMDGSHTKGYLATETLTLPSTTGQPIAFPGFIFGCGKDNIGRSFSGRVSGIAGLGNGKASLVSQLGSSVGGKFSYCLVPIFTEGSSKMNFGSDAVVSGPGTVSTPLVPDGFPKWFYYITMEGISVGDTRLSYPGGISKGNTVIDSGTTFTILPPDFYSNLESAVAKEINLQRVKGPSGDLRLCYQISRESEGDFHPPILTIHFGGADVKLSTLNTFVRVSDDIMCFAFFGNSSGSRTSVYGNVSQMNFLVGYDTQKMSVSFKPTDCSKI